MLPSDPSAFFQRLRNPLYQPERCLMTLSVPLAAQAAALQHLRQVRTSIGLDHPNSCLVSRGSSALQVLFIWRHLQEVYSIVHRALPVWDFHSSVLSMQAAGSLRSWHRGLEAAKAARGHQAWFRRGLQCSASAADAAASQASPSSNGALSKIIDIELRSEAEQSYLAVRSQTSQQSSASYSVSLTVC